MARNDVSDPFHYSASETIVLFLDLHSLFIQFSGGFEAAARAIELKSWARTQNIAIAHALINVDENAPPPMDSKGRQRTSEIIKAMRDDPSKFQEPAGIRSESDDEMVFLRLGGLVSALTSDQPCEMLAWLREKGYKSLILCGLNTSGCVMRTATHATDLGFVVSVVADACHDEEEVHRVVITKILPRRAHVYDLEELEQGWKGKI